MLMIHLQTWNSQDSKKTETNVSLGTVGNRDFLVYYTDLKTPNLSRNSLLIMHI